MLHIYGGWEVGVAQGWVGVLGGVGGALHSGGLWLEQSFSAAWRYVWQRICTKSEKTRVSRETTGFF